MACPLMRADARTQVEAGAIGRKGMLGIPVFFGAEASPIAASCQVAGRMVCLPAKALQEALPCTPSLSSRSDLSSKTLVAQLGQHAGCHRAHNTEQRRAPVVADH